MKAFSNNDKVDNRVLASMITSSEVLGRLVDRWDDEQGSLFSSSANLIGSWCVKHFRKYGSAPKSGITSIFREWAETPRDESLIQALERHLSALSEEYSKEKVDVSSEVLFDQAIYHFNRVKLTKLNEKLESLIEANQIEKGIAEVNTFSKIESVGNYGVPYFHDEQVVKSAFAIDDNEILVNYPGDLGKFYNVSFARDNFVAFVGAQKSGKSYHCLDASFRALLNRKRVGYFQVGDMTEKDIKLRLAERTAGHPTWSPEGWPYLVNYPTNISYTIGDDSAQVVFKQKKFLRPLSPVKAWGCCEELMREQVKSNDIYFKLVCYPNLGTSILGIRGVIDKWILEGWIPDVIVVDYADNLAPVNRKLDPRDQINETWSLMRALSIEYHVLLITATQCSARGFGKRFLDRNDFSGDNRKMNHVTAMFGINMDAEEMSKGVCRINDIVVRRGAFSSRRCVHVARCLALANPCVLSTF